MGLLVSRCLLGRLCVLCMVLMKLWRGVICFLRSVMLIGCCFFGIIDFWYDGSGDLDDCVDFDGC